MSRVALGIVGLGAMGAEMLRVAAAHDDYDVRIAADPDPTARERAAAAHPGVTIVADADDLFAEGLDAIYVATPPRLHADLATRALDAGIAVFCEKPLAIDLADGERMVAAASGGPATGLNFALSDRAAVLEVERAVRAGELGELVSVEIRLAFPQWPREFQRDATWLARSAEGGFLREVFSHFAYITDRIVGELAPVWSSITRPVDADACETSGSAVFSADGVPVRVWAESGSARPETYEWTLHGTERSYRLTDWDDLAVSTGESWDTIDPPGERGSEHTRLSAFAVAVREGKSPHLADFAAGLRVQRVVEGWLAAG